MVNLDVYIITFFSFCSTIIYLIYLHILPTAKQALAKNVVFVSESNDSGSSALCTSGGSANICNQIYDQHALGKVWSTLVSNALSFYAKS